MSASTEPVQGYDDFMPGGDHFGCRMMSLSVDLESGPYQCMGMHCAFCGKPCGAQGHMDCFEKNRESV